MTQHMRPAHLDLLKRAKAALAPDGAASADNADLVADLDCAIGSIAPEPGADAERLEVGSYIALSTRHVSWPTTLKIDEWMTQEPCDRPVSIADTHYGWLLCSRPSSFGEPSEIPADLVAVLAFAEQMACDYLILDRDATASDRLPCFEW
ncbi:hypothetical protein [Sphingopyxis sp. GC21]|uniref:DUF5983 family protein n=1 Tax=Sphingopyxis sp. GC21 TaxID=2933562 RepID=UPI0021E4B7F2|nr:hypothetical protein [Sphingopyxis sp. GC21]